MANLISRWRALRLGDVISIAHGFAFKGEFFRDDSNGNLLVTPGNFAMGGGFQWGSPKYYCGPIPGEFVLEAGDLLVTMTDLSKESDTLGFPALVPDQSGIRFLHNQRIGRIRIKDSARIDRNFLYYLMCTQDYRAEILAGASGTTVKHTAPARIEAYTALVPTEVSEQRTIARVLRSLDDKIELNRRMNRTLENMALALFKSWFVDFDPVVAKAAGRKPIGTDGATEALFPSKFELHNLGAAPKGWAFKHLTEFIEINPKRALATKSEAAYLDMANTPTRGHTPNAWSRRRPGSGVRFKNGDTLLAKITPCLENGKAAYVDFLAEREIAWGSTEFLVLRPRAPLPPEFAYLLARCEEFRDFAIQSMTGSSGRQRVSIDALSRFAMALPVDAGIPEQFGKIVRPWFARARTNSNEIRSLADLRDTLLPQLLSGEIRLETAEKRVGELI